ncbi:MAG: stage 0 sporulation family protein [Clostridia bacterium]|nr:stage 0 sporulation family protein [Clostridia bacterium]
MAEITGVTFKPGGKVYYFAPGKGNYEKGKGVVVETARGVEYATVVIPRAEVPDEKITSPLKPILRAATHKDDETHKKNIERRPEALKTVKEKIAKHNLDMKLIDCEFAFDGSKAVFYYSSPQRVDFRELVKELSSTFHMRIELRQVGIRDEIKLIGGIAPCGRECCCSTCMPNFKKVSIKMAKNQNLSLNPQKISGLCGRLMCCLEYENDYYAEACKKMPKMGSEVGTPAGKGTVTNIDMLKMSVRVRVEDKQKETVTYNDYPVEQLRFRRPPKEKEQDEEEDKA